MATAYSSTCILLWKWTTVKDGQNILAAKCLSRRLLDQPKMQLLPTQPAFSTPVGVIPSQFHRLLLHCITRVPGLLCSIVCVILCLAILVQLQIVTDKQTDTHILH